MNVFSFAITIIIDIHHYYAVVYSFITYHPVTDFSGLFPPLTPTEKSQSHGARVSLIT
jgi:hypothetical protein